MNLDRFSAWGIVLFSIAAGKVAPELRGQIIAENLTVEHIDLSQLEAAVTVSQAASRWRLKSAP